MLTGDQKSTGHQQLTCHQKLTGHQILGKQSTNHKQFSACLWASFVRSFRLFRKLAEILCGCIMTKTPNHCAVPLNQIMAQAVEVDIKSLSLVFLSKILLILLFYRFVYTTIQSRERLATDDVDALFDNIDPPDQLQRLGRCVAFDVVWMYVDDGRLRLHSRATNYAKRIYKRADLDFCRKSTVMSNVSEQPNSQLTMDARGLNP